MEFARLRATRPSHPHQRHQVIKAFKMYGSTPEYDAEALVSKQSESKPVPSQTLYGAIDEEAGGDSQPPHSGARGGRRRRLPVGDGAPRRRRDGGDAGVAERRLLGHRRGRQPAVGVRQVLTLCLSVSQ